MSAEKGHKKYAYFGEQIKQLVNGLVLSQRWTERPKEQAIDKIVRRTGYAESTVYRWGQGRLLPPPDTVKILAAIGRHKTNLDREWGYVYLRLPIIPTLNSRSLIFGVSKNFATFLTTCLLLSIPFLSAAKMS